MVNQHERDMFVLDKHQVRIEPARRGKPRGCRLGGWVLKPREDVQRAHEDVSGIPRSIVSVSLASERGAQGNA